MGGQGVTCVGDGPLVRVQIPLGGGQRAVPGELPQDVHRDAGISHPGEPGVPQVMPHQVLVAEPGTGCGSPGDRCAAGAPGPGTGRAAGDRPHASATVRCAKGCHPPGDPALNRARSPSRARYARRTPWRKRHS
jgi:hypothetical protein